MKKIINKINEQIGLDTILIIIALAMIFVPFYMAMLVTDEVTCTATEIAFRTECYEKFEEAMKYIYSEDYSEENIELAKIMAKNSFREKAEQNKDLMSEIYFASLYVEDMVEDFEKIYNLKIKYKPEARLQVEIEDVETPVLEQELVSIKAIDKPVIEQELKLVSIKDINE